MTQSIQHRDIRSVEVKPAMNGHVRVEVERDLPFSETVRTVHAVTVHGNGRIDFHDDPTGLTPIAAAWHRELAKTARDLRSQVPCALEGDYCIPHSWDAGIQKIRCPQQRLADILAALDDLEKKP